MVIGILKDIKEGENRVIATPGEVATLIGDGNAVKVQKGAGARAGFEDQAYAAGRSNYSWIPQKRSTAPANLWQK